MEYGMVFGPKIEMPFCFPPCCWPIVLCAFHLSDNCLYIHVGVFCLLAFPFCFANFASDQAHMSLQNMIIAMCFAHFVLCNGIIIFCLVCMPFCNVVLAFCDINKTSCVVFFVSCIPENALWTAVNCSPIVILQLWLVATWFIAPVRLEPCSIPLCASPHSVPPISAARRRHRRVQNNEKPSGPQDLARSR